MLTDCEFNFVTYFLQAMSLTEKDKQALQGIVAILTYEDKFDPCFNHLLQLELETCGRWYTEIITRLLIL